MSEAREGPRGERGFTGREGAVGREGERGLEGSTGVQGERGESGQTIIDDEVARNSAFRKRASGPRRLFPLIGYLILATAGVITAAALVRQNDATQVQAIQNCIRANINSAVVNGSAMRPRPDLTKRQQAEGRLLARNLYPVLDCKTSQELGRPVRVNDAEKAKYIELVFKGQAPIINKGRVVGSRPTLFEGIRSYEDIGKR